MDRGLCCNIGEMLFKCGFKHLSRIGIKGNDWSESDIECSEFKSSEIRMS